MPLTFVDRTVQQSTRTATVVDLTLDGSYQPGGYPLAPSDFSLSNLTLVVVDPAPGYVLRYDYAGEKLLSYDTGSASGAALSETAEGTDLSAVSVRVVGFGS